MDVPLLGPVASGADSLPVASELFGAVRSDLPSEALPEHSSVVMYYPRLSELLQVQRYVPMRNKKVALRILWIGTLTILPMWTIIFTHTDSYPRIVDWAICYSCSIPSAFLVLLYGRERLYRKVEKIIFDYASCIWLTVIPAILLILLVKEFRLWDSIRIWIDVAISIICIALFFTYKKYNLFNLQNSQ